MNVKSTAAPPEGRSDPFGLVGARLDSRYEIVSVVAQGGFGVVYRAQHRELRKPVAIKVLKTPTEFTQRQQADFLQRFTEEARTVAQLDHPHIVRVLDFGTSIMPSGAKGPWMALEWLEGVTLEADFNKRIETGASGRTPAETMALMYPIIEAVGIAHEEGVVHRDIKPGNVMIVTGRRGIARLKLLDFGIAKVMAPEERKAADRAQTLTQVQAFSPDYAAPEQVSGMRTGPWTDVHALALLMSEMLTAQVPYEGTDAMEMCANVLSPQRPTPGDRGIDVGPWEPVFARALALRPSDRYENAAEFLTALMNHLPPGVDSRDADLWSSQTGTHRMTPSQDPGRPSSMPPGGSNEPRPSNPTLAEGMPWLNIPSSTPAPTLAGLAPTAPPPPDEDIGNAPTLHGTSTFPPRAKASFQPGPPMSFQPGPPTPPPVPPQLTPEFEVPESMAPEELAPERESMAEVAFFARDPEAVDEPDEFAEPPSRGRSAALLVVLGLFFAGLVALASVLLLRRFAPVAPRLPAPVAVRPRPAPAPAAPPAPAPLAVVDAGPSVDASAVAASIDAATTDAASVVDAVALDASAPLDAATAPDAPGAMGSTLDASVAPDAGEEAPDDDGRHHRSHRSHRSHRHRDATDDAGEHGHRRHRHRHDDGDDAR